LPAAQTIQNGQQTTPVPQTAQASQTAQAAQPTQGAAGSQGLLAQTTARNAENLPQQTVQPSQTSGASTPVLQTGQQLPPVLAELLTSLNKSRKAPVEKITELANFMEQAAETFTLQAPKNMQAVALKQQVLEEMAEAFQDKNPEELKAAIKVIKELSESLAKPTGVTADRQEAQKVLTLALPLYFGEGQTVYPAYIHVYYQEQEDKKNPGQKVAETWLRICLETENIGVVDVAFRLYDENNLDVKVRFTEEEAAIGFTKGIEEVKEQLRQLPFTLGDILVK
jgi:predicted house-cleaning noncanonical NTP pyrophosphatase (MazG superfamily)